MLNADEDALICDLAETYGIFNYKELPLGLVATLAVGLRDNSRIKLKMNNSNADLDRILLASILDHLKILIWFNSKDGQNGTNRPRSILDAILNVEKESDILSFESAEEFEEYRKEIILKKGGN